MLTCKDRIETALESRCQDIRELLQCYYNGEEHPELGNIWDYGLSFDYVPPRQEKRGYFCYQLSWGGPQEEFRFMTEDYRTPEPVIKFVFLDWFEGAALTLSGKRQKLLLEVWNLLQEVGAVEDAFHKSCWE